MKIQLSLILCLINFVSVQLTLGDDAKRPNILIIMADDCTYNDLPVYGGVNAKTPHIDELARQGLTFNKAYLTSAMCQPCRAELFTGLFPMKNGCAWNHSKSKSHIKSVPHFLRPLGYRVGLSGKVHVKPAAVFPFEIIDGFDKNCVRNPTRLHEMSGIEKFMNLDDQNPFCLVVALVEPHVPWVMGDASQYPPEKIKLPPNIADTERTREAFSRYLAEITYMDSQVGEILASLEQSGKSDETLVIFTSEQGSQFPGCKWTNWDTGIHTAFIAKWAGKIAPNQRTNAIIHYADVLPTILDIASSDNYVTSHFDGKSFFPVLKDQSREHRRYSFGMHNNVPEGPSYPVRTIFNGEFRYIENLLPNEMYIEKHLMGLNGTGHLNNPYWGTWIFESQANPEVHKLVKRYMSRPAEQLYQTQNDPYELNNLATNPAYQKIKDELKMELRKWMQEQGDPGIPQDTMKALESARNSNHLYGSDIKKP